MRTTTATPLLMSVLAVSLLGSALARADVPGYEFMMFPEGMAMVVDANGKATKTKITEDMAKAITDGAQPQSEASIVLLYRGKLYIIPDKQLAGGRMMSSTVMPTPDPDK